MMSGGPPISPEASDCCGMGCSPCVWDIYDQELKLWENQGEEEDDGGDVVREDLTKDKYTMFKIVKIIPVTCNTSIYRFGLGSRSKLGHKISIIPKGIPKRQKKIEMFIFASGGPCDS